MSIQIKEGVRYVMADGRKTKQMGAGLAGGLFEWTDGNYSWASGGRHCGDDNCLMRIVRELEPATPPDVLPVRTVSRLVIVPGRYGSFAVGTTDFGRVHVVQCEQEMFTASELRAAARVFESLASALEDEGK